MNRWKGKVALVTGTSTGLGLTIAKTLFKEGMTVVGIARRKDVIEKEMKNVQGDGKFYALKCDISNEEEVLRVFEWIKENLGSVHVLVNNAGVIYYKQFTDQSNQEWEDVIGVHVLGVLYCSKQAIKMLQQSGEEGHIININSVDSLNPEGLEHCVTYVSKMAEISLTTCLEQELIGSKIRVTV